MMEMVRHIVWFLIVSSVIAYAVFLVVGSVIANEASASTRVVVARDVLSPGAHHLSGMVMVPSTCSTLSVRTESVDRFTHRLVFTSWEDPAASECLVEEVPRSFRAVLFAPATGVQILGSLDGMPLTMVVIPVIDKD